MNSLDSPLCRRVGTHAGIADLAADAGQLEESATTLGTQVWQHRAGQLDRTHEVGVQGGRQFAVVEFFHRPDQSVAGVGEDHIDAAEFGERTIDHCPDLAGVGDIEHRRPHLVAEAVQELDEGFRPPRSRRHAVACGEQVLGDRASNA